MVHGPFHYPSKGACIYCGAVGVPLGNEHIVPLSLGGQLVIDHASCKACEDITKKFEQRVAREMWGDARTSFGAPTRRKRERPTHLTMHHPHDPSKSFQMPASAYPAGFILFKMAPAGILRGIPEQIDTSADWKLIVVDDHARRENFLKQHPNKPLTMKFRHVPDAFGRLIVKIGYCQILTLLDLSDFTPICLPYITGEKTNLSYILGGSIADEKPEPALGCRLGAAVVWMNGRLLLAALVRLLANTDSPTYHVVVGYVDGADNIELVLKKLGPLSHLGPAPPS
jgi:hypothetical protein